MLAGLDRGRAGVGLEPILAPKVKDGKVKVVGAVYDLRSGEVKVISS